MRRRAVPWAQAPARDAVISGERGQARYGPGALPALGAFMHRAAAEKDHRGFRARVAAGQGSNALALHSGGRGSPRHVVFGEMSG